MRSKLWLGLVPGVIGVALLATGCTGETNHVDPDAPDPGTGIGSQDFRSISQRMARDLITIPRIQDATTPPKVAFSSVANNSNESLDGDAFLRNMRTELIRNSQNKVVFLDRAIIDEVEREKRDKDRGKRTARGNEIPLGADFFLTGTIDSIDKSAGGSKSTYWRFSFRLTDAATSAIVWENGYEIKKRSSEVSQAKPAAPAGASGPSALSYGMVTSQVKKGVTTQADLVQLFGGPNIATTDADGTETWVYDRTASTSSTVHDETKKESTQNEALNLSVYFGFVNLQNDPGKVVSQTETNGNTTATHSIKSITVIVKFSPNKTVRDFSVRSSSF